MLYDSIRKLKYTEVPELLLVECEKDSEFLKPFKTKLALILLLAHLNVLNLMLL